MTIDCTFTYVMFSANKGFIFLVNRSSLVMQIIGDNILQRECSRRGSVLEHKSKVGYRNHCWQRIFMWVVGYVDSRSCVVGYADHGR
jgi:hypothetical protein